MSANFKQPAELDWFTNTPPSQQKIDQVWMLRALQLAKMGEGKVEPNPMVGCVLVRDGNLVGEGWHDRFGENHAEINALISAGKNAKGATAYVTLEPCCHQGKTGPCTKSLIDAGIRKVIAARTDPFPLVAGKGLGILKNAGIETLAGCCDEESTAILNPFICLTTKGKPWVIAKWAMTLDGKIASRTAKSKWISCEDSRSLVHLWRSQMDAILVGSGTALADNPLLTTRPPGNRIPTRIVLDRRGRLDHKCNLVQSIQEAPLLVATSTDSKPSWRDALEKSGAKVLVMKGKGGDFLKELLDNLGKSRITNLLIEGGGEVFGSFFDNSLVDEIRVFICPTVMGGANSTSPVAGLGAVQPWAFWNDPSPHILKVGQDFLIRSIRRDLKQIVDNSKNRG